MGQGTALVSATVALRLPDGSSSGLQRLQRCLFCLFCSYRGRKTTWVVVVMSRLTTSECCCRHGFVTCVVFCILRCWTVCYDMLRYVVCVIVRGQGVAKPRKNAFPAFCAGMCAKEDCLPIWPAPRISSSLTLGLLVLKPQRQLVS